jgi:predicted metalloprotease with PDZ domain
MKVQSILSASLLIALLFIFAKSANSQDIIASLRVAGNSIIVEGKIASEATGLKSKSWSFLEKYADSDSLGGRVSELKLYDQRGLSIDTKRLVPGEFEASEQATSFSYKVTAEIPEKQSSTAHVSWIGKNHGLIMFNDIFPQWQKLDKSNLNGKFSFVLPIGWRTVTNETKEFENTFNVNDVSKAMFLIGSDIREKRAWVGKNELNLAILGDWKFDDSKVIQFASEILQEHRRIFGEFAEAKSQIYLLPFPNPEAAENWRAETRGSTATIISGILPFPMSAEQRLHEQLRHELFHFWIPNKLALIGNYDWFYEGFTLYQALRTGIQLNQIRFDDYLNTLSVAYRSANNLDSGKLSLIEASNSRWLGSNRAIYTKGFIVAFLCDLAIVKESKGKQSLSDVFRMLWKKHKMPNKTEDGNSAILKIFEDFPEVRELLQNYVSGKTKLEFQNELEFFGLEYQKSEHKLAVLENLSGKQKDYLDKLGYNQWRKLLEKRK